MSVLHLERIEYGQLVVLSIIDNESNRRYWYTDEDGREGHVDQVLFVHETEDTAMRAKVYFNLHNSKWSIKDCETGLVMGHADKRGAE